MMSGRRFPRTITLLLCLILIVVATMAISELRGPARVGQVAPEFCATADNGETLRLSDFRGKKNVVLAFYPKDFTRGCTKQMCSYRDSFAEVLHCNGVVLGVSYDGTVSHARFSGAYGLQFPLISDPDRSISRAYGTARLGGLFPLGRRVTFVIDREGIIRKVVHHELDVERDVEEVLEALRELEGGSLSASRSPG